MYYFTSESVSPGHPDKLCDHLSDAILDHVLSQDKESRVACETFVKGKSDDAANEDLLRALMDAQGSEEK